MNQYWVYAIKSMLDGRIYIGLSHNPDKRLTEHNDGTTKSTKAFRPWILIYKEFVGSREKAREKEKHLKSGFWRERLKAIPV